MLYQVDKQKIEVSIHDIEKEHYYIGLMSFQELKNNYHLLHISKHSVDRCEETATISQNIIIPHSYYYFGLLNLINARDVFVKKDSLAFFIFKKLFLIVILDDEDSHIQDVFNTSSDYVLEKGASISRLVYYFFSELMARDYQYLEELQDEIEQLEEHDIQEESLNFTNRLRHLGKELLLLRNYYENLISMGEELQMNHHNIFEQDDMRYFEIFTKRIERLSENVQMLRELLNQANDAHQSRLDYHLNKTMQFFTVITTIFMPLTLITGWYGMNFKNMPELNNMYSYYVIIGLSLGLVIGLIIWFKKKKFF